MHADHPEQPVDKLLTEHNEQDAASEPQNHESGRKLRLPLCRETPRAQEFVRACASEPESHHVGDVRPEQRKHKKRPTVPPGEDKSEDPVESKFVGN